MRIHTVFFLIVLLAASVVGGQAKTKEQEPVQGEGLIRIESELSAQQTADRLESLIEKNKALTLMARIDHSRNAAKAGLELPPTIVLIFGNPNLGTPLMQAERTIGIDLPQKVLVWEDAEGQTWVAYNDPFYLKERHALDGKDESFRKIGGALKKLVSEAAGKAPSSR